MPINAAEIKQSTELTCDAVIVGSGAGGAAIAWQLSRAGWDVVLLEEGAEFRSSDFTRRAWDSTRTMYRDGGSSVTLGTPGIPLPLGRTWGGTTTVNSGTCLRVPEFVFDKWHKQSNFKLKLDELTEYYAVAEKIQNVEPVAVDIMGAGNTLFAAGAERLGLKGRPLTRNTRDCKGTGLCAFGCPEGAKQSMGQTFLPQAEAAGLRGYVNVRAADVLLKRGKAAGILAHPLEQPGSSRVNKNAEIKVKSKVVILAMGSIHTPNFLLQNQLANSSGEVGRNLRIHPAGKLIGMFEQDIYGWTGVPQAYIVDHFMPEGIVFEGAFVPPSALAFALPALGHELKRLMANYNKLGGFGVMVTDTSAGTVRPGLGGRPLVQYNLNRHDTDLFRRGIAIGCDVYLEAGAKEVLTCLFGSERVRSKAEAHAILERKIRPADLELIAFHPVGTARMGDDAYEDVVNHDGCSYDVPNLYIADASIFPGSPAVNPQLTIMAMALRIGAILDSQKGKLLASV